MATHTDIPSDLTDDYKAFLFQTLDAVLNSGILYALLHGIYTGILTVTLWNIFINKCWPIRRVLVVVIIFLHALTTITFATNWSSIRFAFVENGQNFWTVYSNLDGTPAAFWGTTITAFTSTILTDLYMIWCSWMVWGRRWLVVLFPIFSLVSTIVSRTMVVYYDCVNATAPMDVSFMLYTSFNLATTLSCTLLIIYRVVAVAGVRRGASSALYSISLILDLAFTIRNDSGTPYLDVIASIAKGIAPTLLIGRITAGHRARPDDSWQGSVIGSASIRSQEQEHSRASSQEDRPTSLVLDGDLEAQRESDVREPSPAFFPGPQAGAQSQDMMTLPKFENFPLYHLGDTERSNRVSVESLRLGP